MPYRRYTSQWPVQRQAQESLLVGVKSNDKWQDQCTICVYQPNFITVDVLESYIGECAGHKKNKQQTAIGCQQLQGFWAHTKMYRNKNSDLTGGVVGKERWLATG